MEKQKRVMMPFATFLAGPRILSVTSLQYSNGHLYPLQKDCCKFSIKFWTIGRHISILFVLYIFTG